MGHEGGTNKGWAQPTRGQHVLKQQKRDVAEPAAQVVKDDKVKGDKKDDPTSTSGALAAPTTVAFVVAFLTIFLF